RLAGSGSTQLAANLFGLTTKEASRTSSVRLIGASQDGLKRSYNCCIELTLDSLREPKPRDATRHCISVRPIGGHSVVCVRDCDDPREKRDFAHSELIWIAQSVNTLMMMTNDLGYLCVVVDLRQNPLADR